MSFLANNWLALLSLVVALTGGIPGVIDIINYFKAKAEFHFTLDGLMLGRTVDVGGAGVGGTGIGGAEIGTMIFLAGTVSNEGEKPLTPSIFELEIQLGRDWVNLEKMLIPDKPVFSSDVQNINIENAREGDFQRFKGKIETGQPVYGYIMFTTTRFKLDRLLSEPRLYLRLTCIDVFGKRYPKYLTWERTSATIPTQLPKHGVDVQPLN